MNTFASRNWYTIVIQHIQDPNIFDSSTTTAATVPYTHTKPQYHYYNEYHEGILEIAKSFLKILLNQLIDKTMVAAMKEQ
jgi:hypothetical protein